MLLKNLSFINEFKKQILLYSNITVIPGQMTNPTMSVQAMRAVCPLNQSHAYSCFAIVINL